MSRPWIEESWRLLLFVAAALLIGAFTGQSGWLLSISLLLYIGNLLLRLRRLEQWVRHHDRDPPDLDGVFDEVIYHLHRHRKRQHARRSRIAQELRQFQRSARILPDATVLLDAHDQILWFNRAATDLLGLRSSDTGHAISGLIRSPQFIRLLREHSSDSNYDTLEMMSPVDERILLDLRISSGRNEQRLLLARDVTQLNRLLNMRRDFVANVSHELRTPLTVVIGYLESLLDDDIQETDPATLKSLLGKIYAPAQRMKTLVEDLLLLSRLDTDAMLNAENCPLVEMRPCFVRPHAIASSSARDNTASATGSIPSSSCAASSRSSTVWPATCWATPFATPHQAERSSCNGRSIQTVGRGSVSPTTAPASHRPTSSGSPSASTGSMSVAHVKPAAPAWGCRSSSR